MTSQGQRSLSYTNFNESQINAPEVYIGVDADADDFEAFSQINFLRSEPAFETADISIRAVLEAPNNPDCLRSLATHLYRRCKTYRYAAYQKEQNGVYFNRPDIAAQLSIELRSYDTLLQDLHYKANNTVGDKTELCNLLLTRYEKLMEKTKEITIAAKELEQQLQSNDPCLSIDYKRMKADLKNILQGLEAPHNDQTHTADMHRLRTDVQKALVGEGVLGMGSDGYYTVPRQTVYTTAHNLRKDKDGSHMDGMYSPIHEQPNMLGSTIQPTQMMDGDSQQLIGMLAEVVVKCNLFKQSELERLSADSVTDAVTDAGINVNETDSLATCVYKLSIAVDNAITRAKASINQQHQEITTLASHVRQLQDDNNALGSKLNEYMNIQIAFESYQQKTIEENGILKSTFDQTLRDYVAAVKSDIYGLKVVGNQSGRQWYADNVMFPNTRTASIVEVLYETLGMLQHHSGKEDLNLDIQIVETAGLSELIAKNQFISDDARNTLKELQKIGALVISLRYGVEDCLDTFKTKQANTALSPLSEVTFMQQMGSTMLSIVQSLLSMTLWGSKEKMRECLGMQTAEALMKRVLMIDGTEIPDGFVDDELSKNLVAIMQQISPANADLLPLLEALARVLEEAMKGDYIVPKAVSQLSTVTLNVDNENKQFRQMIDIKDKEILSLQEQVKRREADFQEVQEQAGKYKNQIQDMQKEMLNIKDGYASSALEAQRAVTMDKILEESKQQVSNLLKDKQGLDNKVSELLTDNKKLVAIVQAKETDIGKLKDVLERTTIELNKQEAKTTSLEQNIKEVSENNRELVKLANNMKEQLKLKKDEATDHSRKLASYDEEKRKYESDIKELTAKYDECRKKYEASETRFGDLKIQKMQLEIEWKGVSEQCEKLRKQREELAHELDTVKETVTAANRDKADAVAAQQKAFGDMNILTEQCNILSENNIMLDKKCSDLTAKLVMAEQEIGNLTDLLNEAHISLMQYSKDAESKKNEASNATKDLIEAKATAAEGRAMTEGLVKEVARLEDALTERKTEYNILNDRYKKEVCDLTARLREAELRYSTVEQTLRSEYDQLMSTRMHQQMSTVEANTSAEIIRFKDQLTAADARYKEALDEIKKYYIEKTEAEKQLSEMKAKLGAAEGNETRLIKLTKILSVFKRRVISLALAYERIVSSTEGRIKYSIFNPEFGFVKPERERSASEDSFLLEDEPSMITEERIASTLPYDSAPLNAVAHVNLPQEKDLEEICSLLKAGIKYQYDHEQMKHLRDEITSLKTEIGDERRKTEIVEREKMQLDIELQKAQIENRDLASTVSAVRSASVGSFGMVTGSMLPSTQPGMMSTYSTIDRAQSQHPGSPQSNLLRQSASTSFGAPYGAVSNLRSGIGNATFAPTPSATGMTYPSRADSSSIGGQPMYKPSVGMPSVPALPRAMGYNAPSTLVSTGGSGVTVPNAVGGLVGGATAMPPLGPGAQSYLHGLSAGLGLPSGAGLGGMASGFSRSTSNPVAQRTYPAMGSAAGSAAGSMAGGYGGGSLAGSMDIANSQRSMSASGRAPSATMPSTGYSTYTPLSAGVIRPGVISTPGIGVGANIQHSSMYNLPH